MGLTVDTNVQGKPHQRIIHIEWVSNDISVIYHFQKVVNI